MVKAVRRTVGNDDGRQANGGMLKSRVPVLGFLGGVATVWMLMQWTRWRWLPKKPFGQLVNLKSRRIVVSMLAANASVRWALQVEMG